jgi:hypothetical protein
MPPLTNIKHEKFARAVIDKPSYSQAYKEVYEVEGAKVAGNSASRLLENVGIKNRVMELMNQSQLGLAPIVARLGRWIYDEDHPSVSLDAVKTGLKLHGALDSDEKSSGNIANININIVNLSSDSNS